MDKVKGLVKMMIRLAAGESRGQARKVESRAEPACSSDADGTYSYWALSLSRSLYRRQGHGADAEGQCAETRSTTYPTQPNGVNAKTRPTAYPQKQTLRNAPFETHPRDTHAHGVRPGAHSNGLESVGRLWAERLALYRRNRRRGGVHSYRSETDVKTTIRIRPTTKQQYESG